MFIGSTSLSCLMDLGLIVVKHPCISKSVLICDDLQGASPSGNTVFMSQYLCQL